MVCRIYILKIWSFKNLNYTYLWININKLIIKEKRWWWLLYNMFGELLSIANIYVYAMSFKFVKFSFLFLCLPFFFRKWSHTRFGDIFRLFGFTSRNRSFNRYWIEFGFDFISCGKTKTVDRSAQGMIMENLNAVLFVT